MRTLQLPLTVETVRTLHAGESVLLRGSLYTARDAAHKRLATLLAAGEPLPINLNGETIYYAGPAPSKPGWVIGPAGPTTSSRMDAYTPALLAAGLRCMIGKGARSPEVIAAMRAHCAIYLGVTGGAAALISQHINACSVVAYPELGTEAIQRLDVHDLPAVVLIDCTGEDQYALGRVRYQRM